MYSSLLAPVHDDPITGDGGDINKVGILGSCVPFGSFTPPQTNADPHVSSVMHSISECFYGFIVFFPK